MAAWIPAAITAAATLAGGMQRNKAQADVANAQMAFQREMSDTSYQRQIADLKEAGINPMLVSKLGGASTPAGAMPLIVNPMAEAAQSFGQVAAGMSSAAQAEKTGVESDILSETGLAQAKAQLEKTLAEVGMTAAQTAKYIADTQLVAAQIATERERPAQVRAMVDHLFAQTKTEGFKQLNLEQQTKLLQAQIPLLLADTQLKQNQVEAELNTINMRRHIEQFGPAAAAVGTAVGGFLGLRYLRGAQAIGQGLKGVVNFFRRK